MQAKVDTLRAKSGEEEVIVYPKTLTKCVVNENGELIEDIAHSIAEEEITSHTDLALNTESNNPVANSAVAASIKETKDKIPTVDTTLNEESNNPVANSAVAVALKEKASNESLEDYLPLLGGVLKGELGFDFGNCKVALIPSENRLFFRVLHDINIDTSYTDFVISNTEVRLNRVVDGTLISEEVILHTGNSAPVVPLSTDPGVGASVSYADNTVIVVYE